ncbi:MAG: hemin uptake protein HemP [Planctomycetaceae bacterium]|nr:MAG: hemin uptake protein HemP [Planctomycetaceae bacterium]
MTNEPPAEPSDAGPAPAIARNRPPTDGPDGASEVIRAGSGVNPSLPKIIPFQTLARCGEEIWIENDGQIYRLRRTRQGKLILTK